jgi:nucleotide-binding universal stress UspA family protein
MIVCPTDFSEGSFQALADASEMALHFGSDICLVHVIEPLPTMLDLEVTILSEVDLHEEVKKRLLKIAEPLTAKGVYIRHAVAEGQAAEEIVRMAQELGADLIVIATHGSTGWRHLAYGSVTEKVVRLATCPVLTIRMMSAEATSAPRAA